MPLASTDLVRLARLDATLWEDSRFAYVGHAPTGPENNAQEQCVWRRSYKPLGSGGFGTVFSEECITGRDIGAIRAVKSIQKPHSIKTGSIDISRELKAMALFSRAQYSPLFVQSQGWYEDEKTVFLVMELVPRGSLQQHVGVGLSESETVCIIAQVLRGLSHMHFAGYAHRDLKPENLLVVSSGPRWQVKIADFGLSKRMSEQLSSQRTLAGTLGYMAPEILGLLDDSENSNDSGQETKAQRSFTRAADIWAVGVIAFTLLTGELPFPSADRRALRRYVDGKTPFPSDKLQSKGVTPVGQVQIQIFMRPDPTLRTGAHASLAQPWLKSEARSHKGSIPTDRKSTNLAPSEASAAWTATTDSGYATVAQQSTQRDSVGDVEETVTTRFHETPSTVIGSLEGNIVDLTFSHDGKLLASNTTSWASKCPIRLFKTFGGPHGTLSKNYDARLAFTSDNRHLLVARKNGLVYVFDIAGEQFEQYWHYVGLTSKNLMLPRLAFSADGRLIAYVNELYPVSRPTGDTQILVWNASTGAKINSVLYKNPGTFTHYPIFSADSQWIAFEKIEGVAVLRVGSNGEVTILPDTANLKPFAISPDKSSILCGNAKGGDAQGPMHLRDSTSGAIVKTLANPNPWSQWQPQKTRFSPNGQLIAAVLNVPSTIQNHSILLWDARTGALTTTLKGHKKEVTALVFSPDGRSLASGDHGGGLRLWDLEAIVKATPQQTSTDETAQSDTAYAKGTAK